MKRNQHLNGSIPVAVAAGALLLMGAWSANANYATETFDTGLGSFTTTYGLTDPGFNMGWFNTGNASGSAGEIGGLVNRTNNPVSPTPPGMPRILDTQSFATQPLNTLMTISASGKMYLQDPGSAGSDLNLGFWYYHPEEPGWDPGNQRIVLRIHSPSGGGWRFRPGDGIGSGSRITVVGSDSKQLDFSLTFTPDGGGLGAGTITGWIFDGATTYPLNSYNVGTNSYSLNCFGIWVDSAGSTDFTQFQYMYFDNLQYTVVPEPSAALLLPFGVGLWLFGRRVLRRT